MFPFSNPEIQLDLYRQRADELHRSADEYRVARQIRGTGRHAHRRRGAHAPSTP
jgi:hypothetical protein